MSENQVSLEIDGIPLHADKGSFVIDVADAAGIYIPRFCYHKKLSVAANCRMCLVEVGKAPKPLPACATPVAEGMQVFTKSQIARQAQKAVMEFLLINHPLDCPICDQGGECELQDLAMGYGKDVSRFQERKRVVQDKNLGALIATDMTRCIHCTRCVRFGQEIAGLQELGATGRGEHMEIGTFVERSVESELSGNVIDLCPVGALTSKPFRFKARSWEMTQRDSVAPHDAVGSNLHLHTRGNRVLRVVPRENEDINETWISDRDRFSYAGLYAEDRLEVPMVKRNGRWDTVDWGTALTAVIDGLRNVIEQYGADQIGILASPSSTSEELYILQKLARGIGCPNIDHRLRQTDFKDDGVASVFPSLGQSLKQLEEVGAALLVGSNCRKEQPLANHRLRKAALAGGTIAAVNCVDYEFNYDLAARVITTPAGMVRSLAGIARALVKPNARLQPAELAGLLKDIKASATEQTIAESLANAERATVLLGSTGGAHPNASTLRFLAKVIAHASEATVGYLTDGANGAGAWIAGAVAHREPAGAQAKVSGLNARAMVEKKLRAYVLLGVEPELDCADSHGAREAVTQALFTVCLTAYSTPEMKEYADVLLPIASFAETPGTYVNMEGRWQTFDAAVSPMGEARPAWRVLRVLGNLFGVSGFDYVESSALRDELQEQTLAMSTDRRESWLVPENLSQDLALPSHKTLHRVGDVPIYAADPLVRRAFALQNTIESTNTGIRVNRRVAEKLGLRTGDKARAAQNGMAVTLPVVIDDFVADECVVIPSGVPESVGLGLSYGPVKVKRVS